MTVDELSRSISETVRSGPLADTIDRIEVEPATDDEGDEFLRIKLFVRLPDRNVDEELEAALERIEETVAAIDDRYASVRFLDAA